MKKIVVYLLLWCLAPGTRGLTNDHIQTPNKIKKDQVISNVNFGAFLEPMYQIINSGSTWEHTFKLEGLGENPIPSTLRLNTTLSYETCKEVIRVISEAYNVASIRGEEKDSESESIGKNHCEEILKVSERFNEQKHLLIRMIDRNVQSVRKILIPRKSSESNKRSKKKRSPFDFVGIAGEKLFGIGRKEAIDTALRNNLALSISVNNSFGKIAGKFDKLWSVIRIQNKELKSAIKQIGQQNMQFIELLRSISEIKDTISMLKRFQSQRDIILYNLINNQMILQATLLKTVTSILNTLSLINVQTTQDLVSVQQLTTGKLPINLITPDQIEDTLKSINQNLMKNRLQFQIPIYNTRYYYGSKVAGFYDDSLSMIIKIPLTYVGGTFSLYHVETIKLPMPSPINHEGMREYTKLGGYPEYFAISTDGEYYIEYAPHEISNCKGLSGFPKICNPVKVMNSVRTKPSCGLALYTGNAVMMKKHCQRLYYHQEEPDSQIYQIAGSSDLLITATEGQFVQHCPNGGQMINIKACKLCIITLPCNCILKTKDSIIPPLLYNCIEERDLKTSSEIKYPINLLVLSQILNETALSRYDGSLLFPKEPEVQMWDINVKKIESNSIVGIQNQIMDLDKAIELSENEEDIYLTNAAFVDEPQTIAEHLVKSKYAGIVQLIMIFANVVVGIMAYVGYRKGCSSVTTAAVALQSVQKARGQNVSIPQIIVSLNKEAYEVENDLVEYWYHIRPIVYLVLTYAIIRILYSTVQFIWSYLTTRLLLTPCDGFPSRGTKSNIYCVITNGLKSLIVYVYSVDYPFDSITLHQWPDKPLFFLDPLPIFPRKLFFYEAYWNYDDCLLQTSNSNMFRLPSKLRIPLLHARRFNQIVTYDSKHTIELYVGNDIYRRIEVRKIDPEEVKPEEIPQITPSTKKATEK